MTGTAVITGATRGIGRAVAQAFYEAGLNMLLIARSEDKLKEVSNELEGRCEILAADLTQTNQVQKAISRALDIEANVLVNNLGIYIPDQIGDETTLLDQHLNTNLFPALALSRGIFPKERTLPNGGFIFNIGSIVSQHPRKEAASYTISKYALKGVNDVLREENRERNIHVTGIHPGSVNTSSWDGIDAPRADFVQPEDIAKLIATITQLNPSTLVSEIHLEPMKPGI